MDSLIAFRDKLNQVSPSFCVAKWKQVTIHLQNGLTHSCHHPTAHKVALEEVQRDPSALHNSQFKKQQRKSMLEGVRPPECDYCWRVEDSQSDSLSDRIYKSKEAWASPYISDIAAKSWQENVNPSYAEISFGNLCNLKCSYCFPQFSSRIVEEIQTHGGYPTSENFNNLNWLKKSGEMPISPLLENPYVDAFWKWWPELYPSLEHFRITGGEPLLNKNTFKLLDYIIENPGINSNLNLAINSNLCIPDSAFEKTVEKLKRILNDNLVKKIEVYTSAEANGAQAEYIRFGMNYDQWLGNLHKLCTQLPQLELNIMSTYNVLSLPSYIPFLKDVLAIKREYKKSSHERPAIWLDVPYLRYPRHQAVFIIKPDMLKQIFDQVLFLSSNLDVQNADGDFQRGFNSWEADRIKRVYNVAAAELNRPEFDTVTNRKDFVRFIDEHDRRRGTDFKKTFPELVDFYFFCKSI